MRTPCNLRRRIVVALIIAIIKTSSFAESSHTTLQHVIHEINMGPGCHVRLIDPYGGTAGTGMPFNGGYSKEPPPGTSSIEKLGLNWSCIPRDNNLGKGLAVRFDEAQNRWVIYPEGRVDFGKERGWEKTLRRATRLTNIRASNSSGFAVTEEDTTGDEKWRKRALNFCLIPEAKALCGSGDVGLLRDGRRGNLLPQALRIIRGIQFVD